MLYPVSLYSSNLSKFGNVIPKHAGPEAKGSNPTTGFTLLWARNPLRGNFNQWQVSRKKPERFSLNDETDASSWFYYKEICDYIMLEVSQKKVS
jgi:hypothetical protein